MGQAQRIKGLDPVYDHNSIKQFRVWHNKIRIVSKKYRLTYIATSTLLVVLENYIDTNKGTTVSYLQFTIEGYDSSLSSKAIRNRLLFLQDKGLINTTIIRGKINSYIPSKLLLDALFKN